MENLRSSNNKTGKRKGNFSKFVPILAGTLFLANPDGAVAQNTANQNRTQAEISNSTILDRLNQEIGVSLPDEYNQKVLNFVLNDSIMRTRSATNYTEEFIINEMKKDWGISKQNQLLFIRSSIYGGITKEFLYDWLDDDNDIRSDEYGKALDFINASYEEYIKGFNIYMETGIAEAQQRSNEAQQKTAEYKIEITNYLNTSLNAMKNFYDSRKQDPSLIGQKEIEESKQDAEKTIQLCKEYGIDYKLILSDEILKFYGIEE